MKRCLLCFKEYSADLHNCPFCGASEEIPPNEPIQLSPGTILNGRYLIGTAIGSGGFGILYKAWDLKLETEVAVKEFFCSRLMTRAAGMSDVIVGKKSETVTEHEYRKARFLDEARNLAKFTDSKFIPNVFEFFEENNTAYFVMELLHGEDLSHYLKKHGGKIPVDFAVFIATETGNALSLLHSKGIVHRDVAPDNIFIISDGELHSVLLDLGAAYLPDASHEVIDIILKPGYSPPEQYDSMKGVGVWSDIYALGATVYAAITGVKPDEASNRKIEDKVLPPHEIDANIPENLSNTVMKAMAVEPHMRFKTVKDFLKALNGEKKVITLVKEKKLRKRKRLGGIITAALCLALLSGTVFNAYDKKKSEEYLKKADISFWYSISEDGNKKEAIDSIVSDFTSKFPDVKIETNGIKADEYYNELENAAKNNSLPNIFESDKASEDVLLKARDLENVYKSEQAKSCLFIDGNNKNASSDKKIPLGIEIPMACVITKGNTAIDFSAAAFSDPSDFGTDAVAVSEDEKALIFKNFKEKNYKDESTFFDNQSNQSAVLLTSTMKLNKIRETLTNYQKSYVYYDSDEIFCNYVLEFSMGKGNKNQTAAAERLLSWMLGNKYQNMLMISKMNEGQIPVNETCFKEKTSGKNYKEINNIYKKFVFGNQGENNE